MPTHPGLLARRQLIRAAGLAACTGLFATPSRSQAEHRHAVVSLVGDELEVVYAGIEAGTLLDPNRRRTVADPQGAMDRFALAAVGQALSNGGQPGAVLLKVPPSPLHKNAETLVGESSLALPADLVDAIEQSGASHLIVLTKLRADASIPLKHSHLGVGKLRGLGYYVDVTSRVRMVESGATGQGLLAPYVYLRMTLADARTGAVLRQRSCTAARAYPVAASQTAIDPWQVLETREKVARLRSLLERELAREVPLLLAA